MKRLFSIIVIVLAVSCVTLDFNSRACADPYIGSECPIYEALAHLNLWNKRVNNPEMNVYAGKLKKGDGIYILYFASSNPQKFGVKSETLVRLDTKMWIFMDSILQK